MAHPATRSCGEDLRRGMTDGSYKQLAPNRGGVVETLTSEGRRSLRDVWYGFHETDTKMLPDGRVWNGMSADCADEPAEDDL